MLIKNYHSRFIQLFLLNDCDFTLFFLSFFIELVRIYKCSFFSLFKDLKITEAIEMGIEEGCGVTGEKVQDEVIYNVRHPHGFHSESMYGRVTSTSLLH